MEVREAMEVCAADGTLLGTIERVDGATFVADGQRLAFNAIERVEANRVYLWGKATTYTADDTAAEVAGQQEQSQSLPNTEAQLFVNERAVNASMEERMPKAASDVPGRE